MSFCGVRRKLPLTNGFEPEIGKIPNATTFFIEDHWLPVSRQLRVCRDRMRHRPERGRLAHASRANQDHVLWRLATNVLAHDAEQRCKQRATCREFAK